MSRLAYSLSNSDPDVSAAENSLKNIAVSRSKTVQFGALRTPPKYVEKYRSVSLCPSPLSEYGDLSFASYKNSPAVTPTVDSDRALPKGTRIISNQIL